MAGYIERDAVIEGLRRVPLFADLSEDDLSQLAQDVTLVTRKKQARIFEEGATADGCYVVLSGRAKVVLSGERDGEIILNILEPNGIVGEMSLLDGSARSAALVTLEPSRFLYIPKRAFDTLQRNPAFQRRILSHVTTTLRDANEQLRAICSFQAAGRVAWCLARIAARRGVLKGGSIVIEPRPPHQEIAEMSGCSRETVTRALTRLKTKRCVAWDDVSLRLDVDGLRRYFRGAITVQPPRA